MGIGARLAALRGRIHPPRSVRLRLTELYGIVVFLAGVSLLAITFLLGGHQTVQVSAQGEMAVPGPAQLGSGAPQRTVIISNAGGGLSILSGGGPAGGLAVSQAQFAAQIGRSNAVDSLFFWGGIGLLIVTLLGVGLGWVMSGRMLRPLRTMTNTTQQISEANLHERLAVDGPAGDELKQLGDTIDGLLGRLEVAFEVQGRFVQNASHELRTPLAMMRTSLDVATGKPSGAPAEVIALAAKLGEGLDQAERLLESFLLLARLQNGSAIERSPVSLAETVLGAVETRRTAIDALGLAVALDLRPRARSAARRCSRGSRGTSSTTPFATTNRTDGYASRRRRRTGALASPSRAVGERSTRGASISSVSPSNGWSRTAPRRNVAWASGCRSSARSPRHTAGRCGSPPATRAACG